MKKTTLLLLCLLLVGTLAACRYANASEMKTNTPDASASPVETQPEIECKVTDEADHIHAPVKEEQTVSDPISGYCGNTQTTISTTQFFTKVTDTAPFEYTFMGDYSVTLTDILVNLDYDPDMVCLCAGEYNVDTEFGTGYEVNLSDGYARCEKGQADLTKEQIDTITQIITWAQTHGYPETRCGLDKVD